MTKLTMLDAKRLLKSLKRKHYQKFFAVEFIKRTDGSVRHMRCRFGVFKHLKGGPRAYDPKAHGLLVVFEPEKGYRSIPLDALRALQIEGVRYDVSV